MIAVLKDVAVIALRIGIGDKHREDLILTPLVKRGKVYKRIFFIKK